MKKSASLVFIDSRIGLVTALTSSEIVVSNNVSKAAGTQVAIRIMNRIIQLESSFF